MSTPVQQRRITTRHFRKGHGPYVCLTAYTAPMARLLDPHVDLLLVGDSLGMVVYGMERTVPVTLDMMIAHGAAVVRSTTACLRHRRSAVRQLSGIARAGVPQRRAAAGGDRCRRGQAGRRRRDGGHHPVPGPARHPGLRTYRADAASGERLGGFRVAGPYGGGGRHRHRGCQSGRGRGCLRDGDRRHRPQPLAATITRVRRHPHHRHRRSPACDGQILVTDDLLGLFGPSRRAS